VAEFDLAELRRERLRRWHLAGNPIAGVGEAIAFFRHTGFCLSHRSRTFLTPSLIEAIAGGKHGVPAYADASGHPLYRRYVEIRREHEVRKLVLEAPLLHRRHTHVMRDLIIDFARLLADSPLPDRRTPESKLAARRVLGAVADRGPLSKRALRLRFARGGAALRPPVLDRVLLDLESRLQLCTIDYNEKEGAFYDLFARAERSLAVRAAHRSRETGLDHLVGRYLSSALVVEPGRVREVFRGIASTEEVRTSLDRLIASEQISLVRTPEGAWLVGIALDTRR